MKDITYCVSAKCPKADTCDRWWMNNFIEVCQQVSMSDFFNSKDFYKKGCEYEITKCVGKPKVSIQSLRGRKNKK